MRPRPRSHSNVEPPPNPRFLREPGRAAHRFHLGGFNRYNAARVLGASMSRENPERNTGVLRGYLVNENTGNRVPVGTVLTIGRTSDCGLVIDDSAASRRHVEITARGNTFVWKDLGSTNGTYLNGSRMLAGELKPGDTIRIGETELRFELDEVPDSPASAMDQTMFRETVMNATGQVTTGVKQGKTAELLQAVYSVMNEIASNYDPCLLIDRILETTMRAINAQRGALFLANENADLLPCAACHKVHTIRNGVLEGRDLDDVRISSTVASRVLQNGESVLYQDTDADGELNTAESVISLKLRSIVCVPLRAKNSIMGVLYIDSDRVNQPYTEEDVLLATSVGSSAGLALENVQMHNEILEKQRIEQEIGTAWSIQEGFLVKDWPSDPRFEVFGETRPAKTVGGDFFDFVHINPGKVGILIGDVSGKGVPAALTMAQLLAEFRLRAREFDSPAAVLAALNADLCERAQRGMFCTMAYLVLDLATGRLTGANAGHLPCLRVNARDANYFCEATGPPMGILPAPVWTDETVQLEPGDMVLLYTDGIAEARRAADEAGSPERGIEEYGNERLARFAAERHAHSPARLLAELVEEVHAFAAPLPPHDDCTMIALRYIGDA